jgi:hypothetical protein
MLTIFLQLLTLALTTLATDPPEPPSPIFQQLRNPYSQTVLKGDQIEYDLNQWISYIPGRKIPKGRNLKVSIKGLNSPDAATYSDFLSYGTNLTIDGLSKDTKIAGQAHLTFSKRMAFTEDLKAVLVSIAPNGTGFDKKEPPKVFDLRETLKDAGDHVRFFDAKIDPDFGKGDNSYVYLLAGNYSVFGDRKNGGYEPYQMNLYLVRLNVSSDTMPKDKDVLKFNEYLCHTMPRLKVMYMNLTGETTRRKVSVIYQIQSETENSKELWPNNKVYLSCMVMFSAETTQELLINTHLPFILNMRFYTGSLLVFGIKTNDTEVADRYSYTSCCLKPSIKDREEGVSLGVTGFEFRCNQTGYNITGQEKGDKMLYIGGTSNAKDYLSIIHQRGQRSFLKIYDYANFTGKYVKSICLNNPDGKREVTRSVLVM